MKTKRTLLSIAFLLAAFVTASAAQSLDEGLALKKQGKLAEAATVFEALVQKDSTDLEATTQLATVDAWLHKYDPSIHYWESAIRQQPDNIGYRVGLARVAYWKGDLDRAQEELRSALRIERYSVEALTLMGDVQMARGDIRQARMSYSLAQQQEPNATDIQKKLRSAAMPTRWRLDLGYAADNYDVVRGHEGGTYTQVGYRINAANDVWVRHEYLNHFSHVDNTIEFGGNRRFSKAFVGSGSVAFTPHNDFEPNWKTHFGADYQLNSWLGVTGDYRYLDYFSGSVQSYVPGVRVQARPWLGLSYKHYISHNVDKSVTNEWLVRADYQVHERVSLYSGYARGVEDIPPQLSAFNVVYFTGLVWSASPHWGMRLDWSYEHRPGFYERHSISPGLTYRF